MPKDRVYMYYNQESDPDIHAWKNSLPAGQQSKIMRRAVRQYNQRTTFLDLIRQVVREELALALSGVALVGQPAAPPASQEESPDVAARLDGLALTWSDDE